MNTEQMNLVILMILVILVNLVLLVNLVVLVNLPVCIVHYLYSYKLQCAKPRQPHTPHYRVGKRRIYFFVFPPKNVSCKAETNLVLYNHDICISPSVM